MGRVLLFILLLLHFSRAPTQPNLSGGIKLERVTNCAKGSEGVRAAAYDAYTVGLEERLRLRLRPVRVPSPLEAGGEKKERKGHHRRTTTTLNKME